MCKLQVQVDTVPLPQTVLLSSLCLYCREIWSDWEQPTSIAACLQFTDAAVLSQAVGGPGCSVIQSIFLEALGSSVLYYDQHCQWQDMDECRGLSCVGSRPSRN